MTDPKSPIQAVSHLHHGGNKYSITLDIADVHTAVSTTSYPHCPGSQTDISILGLSPDDVLRLGNFIIEQAFRIKGLQEAGNDDREADK